VALDEVFVKINGVRQYLWRAVDQHGNVLDILVRSRCDAKAAKRFMTKLMKKQQHVPRALVTDRLKSYGVAHRELMSSVEHRAHSRQSCPRTSSSHRRPHSRHLVPDPSDLRVGPHAGHAPPGCATARLTAVAHRAPSSGQTSARRSSRYVATGSGRPARPHPGVERGAVLHVGPLQDAAVDQGTGVGARPHQDLEGQALRLGQDLDVLGVRAVPEPAHPLLRRHTAHPSPAGGVPPPITAGSRSGRACTVSDRRLLGA
jgi:hypothetical protein